MEPFAIPSVPVSWGELLDKITILEIKRERIDRPDALRNVETEHRLLREAAARVLAIEALTPLIDRLRRVNETLWDIEDAIREQEADARFGTRFVALARSVYKTNDERAALKRRINTLLQSELVEEKCFSSDAEAPLPDPALIAEPAH
ncbi:DUF6165 family protein [Sphingomonas tabacisoli]|uniref:DUF6165 family protein n=1 Tax=Sphingomonas tabacisoli TaxID=2249466 RepID=A0ABW4I2G4_9SPHN